MTIGKTQCLGAFFSAAVVSSAMVWAAQPPQAVQHLNQLSCAAGEVAKFDGANWVCAEDIDTDTSAATECAAGEVLLGDGSCADISAVTDGSLQQQVSVLVDALVVCPPGPTRFVDNGDGTVCDHQTGLMWEMKDASDGANDLSNPHDVDNSYTWSSTGTDPDGTAFTDFLARLNGDIAGSQPSEQLSGYRDWRLPTSAELQTILDCSFGSPCIDPTFGPTAAPGYWSSTSDASGPSIAWDVGFIDGNVLLSDKILVRRVRAVRGGR